MMDLRATPKLKILTSMQLIIILRHIWISLSFVPIKLIAWSDESTFNLETVVRWQRPQETFLYAIVLLYQTFIWNLVSVSQIICSVANRYYIRVWVKQEQRSKTSSFDFFIIPINLYNSLLIGCPWGNKINQSSPFSNLIEWVRNVDGAN